MGRPRKPDKLIHITTTLAPDTLEKVDEIIRERTVKLLEVKPNAKPVSRSEVLRDAVEEYIEGWFTL
ncbi:MAG: hypothetical protein GTO22_14475 [Gemmatimonadales bacterium]|nr:hypothetical protein [Gemmatimonadales bacterium]